MKITHINKIPMMRDCVDVTQTEYLAAFACPIPSS